jgi:glycosyltransferase involved in cell wall biosynthesis
MIFSLVIPVYNVEKYVGDCIESILRQSYPNYEIILVDDGSTDDSGTICDRYAEQFPEKVKVIHNENQGPMRARLCGVQAISGDVCLFVDSDDYLRDDALDLLQNRFLETGCDMILFNASTSADFSGRFTDYKFRDGQCFANEKKAEIYEMIITTNKLNPLWLKAVQTNILAMIPESYHDFTGNNANDLMLSLPLLTNAKKICYLDQSLYYYRPRPDSIVHSYNPKRHQSIKKVHMELEKYIDEWGLGALHGKHYAREVRGWIVSLKRLLMNSNAIPEHIMHELSEDDYFRKAYGNMDHSALSGSERTLSKWLYRRKYRRLLWAGKVLRFRKAAKQKMKRSLKPIRNDD